MRFTKRRPQLTLGLVIVLVYTSIGLPGYGRAWADTVFVKNGCQYEGDWTAIRAIGEGVNEGGGAGGVSSALVIIVHDGLRRTYIPKYQLAANPTPRAKVIERIKVNQRVAGGAKTVGRVGQAAYVSPFDEYGRRYVVINTERGPVDIHQGITEITPEYCVVEGLQTDKNSFRWELRVATSSIPRDILTQIIYRQIDPKNPNERMKIVQLFLEAERYKDAVEELQGIIADFPELADRKTAIDGIRSAYARKIIKEIETRFDAGQFDLAYQMIESFPTKDIADEILGRVLEMRRDHLQQVALVEDLKEMVASEVERTLKSAALDDEQKRWLSQISEEITRDLNLHNVGRLADFRRFYDDASKTTDAKTSLAVSGWLLGGGSGDGNLAVSLAQVEVRDLVFEYLSKADQARREAILARLEELEGSLPDSLAKIVENLLPVKPLPQEQIDGIPDFYRVRVPGVDDSHEIEYVVQLPPQYDPYRKYPVIMTLGDNQPPERQVNWWAGGYDPQRGMRMGQATRYGYIVISPKWKLEDEVYYRYSVKEHAAVIFSLQDAMRRFSIDTDRVFLTGHSHGGSAAWDIGLAHPDLWAGIVPIGATADKYVRRYWENPRDVSALYFVHGERDFDCLDANKSEWNRYLQKPGFDVTISEYLGRGHEDYYEDIHRIFDWMNVHRRNFFPKEFECVSLRPTDNFFWYVESSNFRETTTLLPAEWPKDDVRDAITSAEIRDNNRINVRTAGTQATVWLSPEIIDFSQPINGRINTTEIKNESIRPERRVLLEDVRRRGDRLHPFWAKIEAQSSR